MSEDNPTPTPTARELEVLKILWELGAATVRQVYERMRQEEDLAQNTVQTFLRGMQEKGLVSHRLKGRAFVYKPLYSRERSLAKFLDSVFDGAADQLVVSLLRAKKLSKQEMDAIEQLISDARRQPKRKG